MRGRRLIRVTRYSRAIRSHDYMTKRQESGDHAIICDVDVDIIYIYRYIYMYIDWRYYNEQILRGYI